MVGGVECNAPPGGRGVQCAHVGPPPLHNGSTKSTCSGVTGRDRAQIVAQET